MSLREKATQMNSGIEFMEGRTNGDIAEITKEQVTIREYDFLKDDDNKDYLVFTVDGVEDKFFFGGSVVSEKFKKFDEYDKDEINRKGLPAVFYKRKSKNRRDYTDIIFFPSEKDFNRIAEQDKKEVEGKTEEKKGSKK
jgi:hypothetical protein